MQGQSGALEVSYSPPSDLFPPDCQLLSAFDEFYLAGDVSRQGMSHSHFFFSFLLLARPPKSSMSLART